MSAADFELVPIRTPEGLILYFRHLTSPWVFRVVPFRDPDQPRLWCLRMEPCSGASLSAKTARIDPFYTSLAMTREELAGTLDQIRLSTSTWLEVQEQGDLCRWLDRVTQMPVPLDFAPPEPPAKWTRPLPEKQSAQSAPAGPEAQ